MFELRVKTTEESEKLINSTLRKKILTPFSYSKVFNGILNSKKIELNIQIQGNKEDYLQYLSKRFDKLKNSTPISKKEIGHISFTWKGTSSYNVKSLNEIFILLKKYFKISSKTAISITTTPELLSEEAIDFFIKNGLSNLILDISTFAESGRKRLNLYFDENIIINLIDKIKERYSGKLSLIILYNYPYETKEEILYDAQRITQLEIDTVYFNSYGDDITRTLSKNSISFDYHLRDEKELYDRFVETLIENGYHIHNFNKFSLEEKKNTVSDVFIEFRVRDNGKIGDYEYTVKNRLLTYYIKNNKFASDMKKLITTLENLKVDLTDIRKLTGDNLYPEVMKLLYQYCDDGLIEFGENSFTYKGDGLFWGNTIIYTVIKTLIELNK